MEISLTELFDAIGAKNEPVVRYRPNNSLGLRQGLKVVIRTVTYHYAGEVVDVDEGRVALSNASWIADSGRWSEFLQTGDADEVEMYPDKVSVSLGSIVDWSTVDVLPSSTK